MLSIFSVIFSRLIGTFPSYSHSQAAANEPNIDDSSKEFVDLRPRLAYARRASPAPTASRTLLA